MRQSPLPPRAVSDSLFGAILPSAYLKQIKEIDLSFNKIERIPNGIGNLSTLTCLKLQNNRIEKVPHFIGRLCLLKDLNLSHNLILEIPAEFKRLQELETLDLSMQVFPESQLPHPQLRTCTQAVWPLWCDDLPP